MFTVIIPLYNKAPYLQRALDSVYTQTVPVDEILVVNDGSTDGGGQIAHAQTDPRVRVIDQPNQGVSAARNRGIAAATNPFLAFLDADDWWLPGFLRRIREMIDALPGAALYGTGFATVRNDQLVRTYGVRLRGADSRAELGLVDYFRVATGRLVICASSMVVSKATALAAGGFPVGVALAEDHEFWARLALQGRFALAPEPLTRYDVGVPGQAATYWQTGYKTQFDILPYHRFLASEWHGMNRQAARRRTGFVPFCRHELATALLQRLYWNRFDAAEAFCRELHLETLPAGCRLRFGRWLAAHRSAQAAWRGLMRMAQGLRGTSERR
jgi:glycosyltransferase involved in cell wall biosynthesis